MMIDGFSELLENITVFEPSGTFSDDGKPSYTKLLTLGIWKDSSKVIQTGLSSYVTAKSNIILSVNISDNSLVERGDVSAPSTKSNKVLLKKVRRDLSGNFEGCDLYL